MIKLPQIPGYMIIRKLGHGGMADVFLGIQENLQREVAIKVLESSLFRDEQFSERFKNEAVTAAKLSHPNIITIHDIGQVENTYYIVMEYLPESLKDRLQKIGAMTPREALDIVKMIASALDYAHNKGFIHRDIKPDNIMFRVDGTAVLVDFGIARAMDSSSHLTRTGTSIGTPYYMSPEQCRGEKIDGRSDIYALGVQLYQLLTGTLPYKAENTMGIILKHIQDPVPRLPIELSQYQILLDKMMAKDKDMRISGGAELVKFIDAFLTAQEQQMIPVPDPILPGPGGNRITEMPTMEQITPMPFQPGAVFSIPKQVKNKKWLLPSLAAFAVIIATGTIIYFSPQSHPAKNEAQTNPVKETVSNSSPGNNTQKTNSSTSNSNSGNSQSPTAGAVGTAVNPKTKSNTDSVAEAEDDLDSITGAKPGKTTPSPLPIITTTLADLHPDIRNEYNSLMEELQIPLIYPNLTIMGQVTVNLAITQNGKINIQNYQPMLLVKPLLHEKLIKLAIAKKIKNMTLPPPKNKKGAPIEVGNWRIIYKVKKSSNRIILAKQNKDS